MLALVLDGKLQLRHDYAIPESADDEALVRVRKAGICNTDLELVKGYLGFRGIIGHEFVGEVERHPDPKWIGERVVGEINIACRRCSNCRAGRTSHCLRGAAIGIREHDGAFAEYLVLPTQNLHLVPPDVPDDAAVFTEPLAAAFQILQQVHVRPTDRVLVLGDGKLGLLCAQVLALTRCSLTIVGRHNSKLQLAEQWGIATVRVRSGEPLPAALHQADIVVECTGSAGGFNQALELTRACGTVVMKSTFSGSAEADITRAVVSEVTLIGSRCGPFPPALKLLAESKVDVLSLVEAQYSLTEAVQALDHAARRGILKVLLNMG